MADNKSNQNRASLPRRNGYVPLIPDTPRRQENKATDRRYVRRELAREMDIYDRRSGRATNNPDGRKS